MWSIVSIRRISPQVRYQWIFFKFRFSCLTASSNTSTCDWRFWFSDPGLSLFGVPLPFRICSSYLWNIPKLLRKLNWLLFNDQQEKSIPKGSEFLIPEQGVRHLNIKSTANLSLKTTHRPSNAVISYPHNRCDNNTVVNTIPCGFCWLEH